MCKFLRVVHTYVNSAQIILKKSTPPTNTHKKRSSYFPPKSNDYPYFQCIRLVLPDYALT